MSDVTITMDEDTAAWLRERLDDMGDDCWEGGRTKAILAMDAALAAPRPAEEADGLDDGKGADHMADPTDKTVSFEELVGAHRLTGVDRFNESIRDEYGDGFQDCESISFCLDGIVYTVSENPEDGYRSSHRDTRISRRPLVNVFPAVDVLVRVAETIENGYGGNESASVLEITSVSTDRMILRAGTGNTDDYYPYFVAEYDPAAMAQAEKA